MGTTILSFEDRVVIETLHHEKHSLQYIADYLGFSKTTIFNEVYRLAGEYHAVKAQTDHEVKLSHRGRKTILTTNLKRLIEEKIKIQKWSIEQVAHVVRIAYKIIYNWIDQGLLDINVTDLPNHGIRRYSSVFVANELKKPVVVLVMDVPSKIVQLKFLIVILQVTSKLIQFYLENVKVKQ